MILSGDIGGTKSHLALFEPSGEILSPVVVKSYVSQAYRSLNELVEELLAEHRVPISCAAFGIAGPIVEGRSKLTNLGWDVDSRDVAALLNLDTVGLLNDLEATAYGTLRLQESEKVTLQPGSRQENRPIAVIAAGTGLGEGALMWDGARYRSIPSEGGHTDFGPRSELEIELLRFLLSKYRRVSYERIVCGPGLLNLYEFFRTRADQAEPEWLQEKMSSGDPAAAISEAALEGTDQACVNALDMFVTLYGAEAGNLALKILATGGVFVGGGIAPKILEKIRQGPFMESFVQKGRYQPLLETMPVEVVTNEKTALLGAAHYALIQREL
ncbi:MAG: glucokinase [Bacteroidota bacterium]